MFKTIQEGIAFVAFGAAFALLAPQNPTNPNNPNPTAKPPATAENQDPDHSDLARRTDNLLAAWLIIENNNEVALSKIALSRSKNDEVKRFAQQMVDDHTAFAAKLREFAPGVGGLDGMQGETKTDRTKMVPSEPPKAKTEQETRADGTTRDRLDEDSKRPPKGMIDHVELIRELGAKCLESATLALNEKQDAAFDRCFMGMQLMAHQKAADTLEVFQRYASPNLSSTLDSGLQTVRGHLDHAKKMALSMEKTARDDMQTEHEHDHDNPEHKDEHKDEGH